MNATMLSGGIRAGSSVSRRRIQVAVPVVDRQTPAAERAPALGVAERGGVWCVIDQDGATLVPCADESTARTHAAALSRLSSLFRP
jgi:hypothetical protein